MKLEQATYSGTPLARKLGIGPGTVVLPLDPPDHYERLLAPLPDGVTFVRRLTPAVDVVHVFTARRARLLTVLRRTRRALREDAAIWVSWPKKASKVPTDITEDVVREVALPLGLVDIKVCAVDAVWSGLKLVIRRQNRTK